MAGEDSGYQQNSNSKALASSEAALIFSYSPNAHWQMNSELGFQDNAVEAGRH